MMVSLFRQFLVSVFLFLSFVPSGKTEEEWRRQADCTEKIRWRKYEEARREAREKKQPLLLLFVFPESVWCKKQEWTFKNADIVCLMNRAFSTVKVDAYRDEFLVKAMKVEAFPTVVVFDPEGGKEFTLEGYRNPEQLVEDLWRNYKESQKEATEKKWLVFSFSSMRRFIKAFSEPVTISEILQKTHRQIQNKKWVEQRRKISKELDKMHEEMEKLNREMEKLKEMEKQMEEIRLFHGLLEPGGAIWLRGSKGVP